MAIGDDAELIDRFEEFYRDYYRNEIGELAQKYPSEQRSLYLDWNDLYRYDPDIADDFIAKPGQMREYAEEALRLYDLPVDVKLGGAHIRVRNLSDATGIRDIRADHVGNLVAVQGIVRKATDVRPKMQEAAFECQRCGTLTRIPQSGGDFQEPHQCQGCERQGPFKINFDQSEFVDAQKLRIQESPEGLRGGETPQAIDVNIEDDITGRVTAGDHVTATGILHLEQQGSQQEKSSIFDFYMEGLSIKIEDEQFEEMDISDEDEKRIVELSSDPEIYDQMVKSMAPSIFGYQTEKLAIIMQLFSGVRKSLPDGSRIRGDIHILLIGDPGTGKSQILQYVKKLAPRSVYTSGKGSSSAGLCVTGDTVVHTEEGFTPIRDIAHEEHPDPVAENTAAEREMELYSFDRETGDIRERLSSHVWRMPEKPCCRIETAHGKELEASVNTPVLTCGDGGLKWKPISEVTAGEYVAAPKYMDIDRETPPVSAYIDYTNEKLRLSENSIESIRNGLQREFGTLRDAAAALDLTEDFIYDSLSNRFLTQGKLDRLLEAIGMTREDVTVRRAMLAHGSDVRIPREFDEDLLYLIGLVFGDGDISLDKRGGNREMVRISNGDEALLERAADIIEQKFDRQVEIEYQDDRVPCIRLTSATIARFFSNVGMVSPKENLELDSRLTTAEHADAFLRGLMDADGSVTSRTSGSSSIQLSTISKPLARQVQLMLETYGVAARRRSRDRRGGHTLENGHIIESKHVQHHLTVYGRHIDQYAEAIGFESAEKRAALGTLVGASQRREEKIPVGGALQTAQIGNGGGAYYMNFTRGDNPGRGRAREILDAFDLGGKHAAVEEAVDADLVWEEVTGAVDTGKKEVYDLSVPETHNFLGNGLVTHNTAAAVRDDFGDGQQWTLEAGALVLADQGVAAVDELDKMRCVTGDTLVHCVDGRIERIGELAREAGSTGGIEPLQNGRTIRDVDLDVWTMTEGGKLVQRPVTAIHEYEPPTELTEVTLGSGRTLRSTTDHPFFVDEGGGRVEKPASRLAPGERVYVPPQALRTAADGGVLVKEIDEGIEKLSVETARVASVETIENEDKERVYDLTVEGTHNFVANGMVVHNSEDQSAMHQALEQQEISISKAGINATLKSRCSLLGAANPTYGRFDEYEPVGEQIDLDPPLISRFDLIFTVTDKPDKEKDQALAEHIIKTNYAGELNTHRVSVSTSNVSQQQVDNVTEEVVPEIDPELLRKYVAYAKRNCYPTMTEEAKTAVRDFYVDMRTQGSDDSAVPVTARKLEALVRLAEASARIRLSDRVTTEDTERTIAIVQSSLEDVGMDPETGELDADMVEAGTSKSQRDRIKNVKGIIRELQDEYEDGAPYEQVIERAETGGIDRSKAEHEIQKLKDRGDIYEPKTDHLRVV